MGKRLTGRVRPKGLRFEASLKSKYLGVYDTEAEAKAICRAAVARLREEARAPVTLAGFSKGWFDEREIAGVTAVERERSCWRTHVASQPFVEWPIRRIKPKDLHDWAKRLLTHRVTRVRRTTGGMEHVQEDKTISRQTALHALKLVRLCLEAARIQGLLPANPAAGIRVPKVRHAVDDDDESEQLSVFLTTAEIGSLMQLALPSKARAVFAVAIYAGLRKGELWGLRWKDVDLDDDRPLLRVRRTRRGGPKSKTSRRDVPLFRPAREALALWRRQQQEEQRVQPITSAGELVFPNAHGEMHSESYQAGWPDKRERRGEYGPDGKRALRVVEGWKSKAGIARPFRFHDMRHTCASHLVMGTWGRVWSLYEVKEFMGHSDIKVTQRYAHLSPQSIHGARAEMERDDETRSDQRRH